VRVLVVNIGSSSLKLRVLDESDEVIAARDLPAPRAEVDEAALATGLAELPDADAVGHRVVHGGTRFLGPVRLDGEVVAELRALTDLAPLHQPKSLAGIEAVGRALPELPAVACFDTAFHATLPAAAATYALPAEWRERFGVRRYGFHGLSHAYAARRAAEFLGAKEAELRVVTCHLGAGASLAAVQRGQSVDTTMGFTPLEGLVMATRSGSVDPGLILWLLEHTGMAEPELAHALEHEAGLLALAGSADMREVLAAAERGEERARTALDVYVHALRAGIAAMAAAMGGLDAVAFTGGVGENAPAVRAAAAAELGFLGLAVDEDRNRTVEPDGNVSSPGAPVHTLVIAAREDLEIVRQVRELLDGGR
jgi:acetate kinase